MQKGTPFYGAASIRVAGAAAASVVGILLASAPSAEAVTWRVWNTRNQPLQVSGYKSWAQSAGKFTVSNMTDGTRARYVG